MGVKQVTSANFTSYITATLLTYLKHIEALKLFSLNEGIPKVSSNQQLIHVKHF